MSSDAVDLVEDDALFKALANPTRRMLIVYLGNNDGKASVTQIRDELNIRIGTLYHHLEALGELISQDAKKAYILTDRGFSIYFMLTTQGSDMFVSTDRLNKLPFGETLFFGFFFNALKEDPLRFIGNSGLILFMVAFAMLFSNSVHLFLYIETSNSAFVCIISYLVFMTFIFVILELLSFIMSGEGGHLALLEGIITISLVMGIYAIFSKYILFLDPSKPMSFEGLGGFVFLLLFQLLALGMLAQLVMSSKELSTERSIIVTLGFAYIIHILAYLVTNGEVVMW